MRYRLYNLHDFRFLLTQFFGTAVTVNYNTMTVVNRLTIYTFLKCVFENLTWFWTTQFSNLRSLQKTSEMLSLYHCKNNQFCLINFHFAFTNTHLIILFRFVYSLSALILLSQTTGASIFVSQWILNQVYTIFDRCNSIITPIHKNAV